MCTYSSTSFNISKLTYSTSTNSTGLQHDTFGVMHVSFECTDVDCWSQTNQCCRAISVRIAAECQQLLDEMSTTIEQDKQQLMTTGQQELAHMPWKHAEHQKLALKYRIARKQTLYTVIQDLEALVCLLFADDMLNEGKSMLC